MADESSDPRGSQFSVREGSHELNFVAIDDPDMPDRTASVQRAATRKKMLPGTVEEDDDQQEPISKAAASSARGRAVSTSHAPTAPPPATKPGKRHFMGGFLKGVGAAIGVASKDVNPHGHTLLPASQSEMSGWLYKQGSRAGGWQKRYFVLHGAILSYYDSQASAQGPDEGKCRGCGEVVEAERWALNEKPKEVADSIYNSHKEMGFRIQTEDPGSLAMRVGKVGDPKGQWFNTPAKDAMNLVRPANAA